MPFVFKLVGLEISCKRKTIQKTKQLLPVLLIYNYYTMMCCKTCMFLTVTKSIESNQITTCQVIFPVLYFTVNFHTWNWFDVLIGALAWSQKLPWFPVSFHTLVPNVKSSLTYTFSEPIWRPDMWYQKLKHLPFGAGAYLGLRNHAVSPGLRGEDVSMNM